MEIDCCVREPESAQFRRILDILPMLTEKQHEVLGLVAENRTSKEIAWELGISASAVNQRIESVRNRTGAPPRAELARVYRQYLKLPEPDGAPLVDLSSQSSADGFMVNERGQDEPGDGLELAGGDVDGAAWHARSPSGAIDRIVPQLLDGPAAGVNRMGAMVLLAGGLLLVTVFGFDVATAMSWIP